MIELTRAKVFLTIDSMSFKTHIAINGFLHLRQNFPNICSPHAPIDAWRVLTQQVIFDSNFTGPQATDFEWAANRVSKRSIQVFDSPGNHITLHVPSICHRPGLKRARYLLGRLHEIQGPSRCVVQITDSQNSRKLAQRSHQVEFGLQAVVHIGYNSRPSIEPRVFSYVPNKVTGLVATQDAA
ncbi:hypothetical protein PSACC_01159 [Paramicrosporidium saccamoebae]|uniref:Uncharacterized protein n=1 Tax=Paramicrosporidium saccamoebae TaxID=1246581 RepID=A0A2H9TMZ7_9FUNG|nr:hypothetical protein PSACC_01159 [Paramicrosporidium saccamoebae]